jgi:acetyl-CoA carboxylase biotin carboxyl carrier protein
MTVDEIRELIKLVSESGIAELEVQRGTDRVRIQRGSGVPGPAPPFAAATAAGAPVAASAAGAPSPAPAFENVAKSAKAADPNVIIVQSPIIGTFYESPSPGAPPFVRLGERVRPGQVLCIIEAMKQMNPIEAETEGVVESKLVLNGQPVEFGEALFALRTV